MGFSREEWWVAISFSGRYSQPFPGIEPVSPVSPALAGGFFTTEPSGKPTYPHLFLDVWRLDQTQPPDITEDGPGVPQ